MCLKWYSPPPARCLSCSDFSCPSDFIPAWSLLASGLADLGGGGGTATRGDGPLGDDADLASGDGDETGTAEEDTGDGVGEDAAGGGGGFSYDALLALTAAPVAMIMEWEKSNGLGGSSLEDLWCIGTSNRESSPGVGKDKWVWS